jgi:hypothetical protein
VAVPGSAEVSEANLRLHVRQALEARDSGEFEEEVTNWRSAYIMAVQLKNVAAVQQATFGLEQAFKDPEHALERITSLRSGAAKIRDLAGANSPLAAQVDVQLAVALEDNGKRTEAATVARRALAVLESTLGPKSREFRETLRTLAVMFEEDGHVGAAEFTNRYDELERQLDAQPVFGFSAEPKLRALLENLRATVRKKNLIESQFILSQVVAAADKLEEKNPYRSKVMSEAAALCFRSKALPPEQDVKLKNLAETQMRRVLDIRERVIGTGPLADVSSNSLPLVHLRQYQSDADILTAYYGTLKDSRKQEDLLNRSLATVERALGPNHPALAAPLRKLAEFYYGSESKDRVRRLSQGNRAADPRLSKAIDLATRELKLFEAAFGADDPILLGVVTRLAEFHGVKGDDAKAKEYDERVTKLREQASLRSPEQNVRQEVKQLRAFLRFEDAEDQVETFKKLFPDKSFTF